MGLERESDLGRGAYKSRGAGALSGTVIGISFTCESSDGKWKGAYLCRLFFFRCRGEAMVGKRMENLSFGIEGTDPS